MTTFTELGFADPILRALKDEGYEKPTPIQAKAIPHLMNGNDLLGIAQTGTGKTAAFALPILHALAAGKRAQPGTARALILAPTRELVAQIADSFKAYGRHLRLSVTSVVGGVGYTPQTKALRMGVDVLVATPGRLLDHLDSGNVRLNETAVVVLDEADHMLDLGFVVPIRKIIAKLPKQRQSMFFSATMPKEIAKLASEFLKAPKEVAVAPVATTAERVNQQVWLVDAAAKRGLLVELLNEPEFNRTIVFTRTKRGADRVSKTLDVAGISSAAIHGNKSQNQRQRALDDFKAGKTRVLVATDIAARGIDIDSVSHVVNFELPDVPEQYVHRIGRTARAGASGSAIAFCDASERGLLKDIERTTRQQIPSVDKRGQKGADVPAAHTIREEEHRDPRAGRGGRGAPRGAGAAPSRGKPRHAGGFQNERSAGEARAPRDHRSFASTEPVRPARPDARPANGHHTPRDDRRGDDRRNDDRRPQHRAEQPRGEHGRPGRPQQKRFFGQRRDGGR
jgi:ATP-dependent RNA helicase RhlE